MRSGSSAHRSRRGRRGCGSRKETGAEDSTVLAWFRLAVQCIKGSGPSHSRDDPARIPCGPRARVLERGALSGERGGLRCASQPSPDLCFGRADRRRREVDDVGGSLEQARGVVARRRDRGCDPPPVQPCADVDRRRGAPGVDDAELVRGVRRVIRERATDQTIRSATSDVDNARWESSGRHLGEIPDRREVPDNERVRVRGRSGAEAGRAGDGQHEGRGDAAERSHDCSTARQRSRFLVVAQPEEGSRADSRSRLPVPRVDECAGGRVSRSRRPRPW